MERTLPDGEKSSVRASMDGGSVFAAQPLAKTARVLKRETFGSGVMRRIDFLSLSTARNVEMATASAI